MKHHNLQQTGFSLIELMIAVAIIAIVTAIAIPAYTGYIQSGRWSAAQANSELLRIAIEDFRLENGGYGATSANTAAVEATYGWEPQGDQGAWTYSVVVPGAAADSNYDITVTHTVSGSGVTCPTNAACNEF